MVEHADEYLVCLPVYLGEFDGYQFHLLEHFSRKEIRIRIKTVQNLPFVTFYYRLQLEYVAH